MIHLLPISSSIEGYQDRYGEIKKKLNPLEFQLGGGYEYDHGYLDKALDWEEEHGYRYYLRIPIYAVEGELESEDALVRLGKPFVIKHEFLTGNDLSGDIGITTALVNQFSEPLHTEHDPIDDKWIERAKSIIQKVEQQLL